MGGVELFGVVGFALAAYAVVANDSIQTLGTFLSSNHNQRWWVLWLYASGIMVATIAYGYVSNGGDVAFDRLDKLSVLAGDGDRSGMLLPHVKWWHALPPLILLIVFLGVYPKPVLDRIEPAVESLIAHVEERVPGFTSPGTEDGSELSPVEIATHAAEDEVSDDGGDEGADDEGEGH